MTAREEILRKFQEEVKDQPERQWLFQRDPATGCTLFDTNGRAIPTPDGAELFRRLAEASEEDAA